MNQNSNANPPRVLRDVPAAAGQKPGTTPPVSPTPAVVKKKRGRGAPPKTPEELAALKAKNRERFVNVGGDRASTVIAGLAKFSACANRKQYEYDAADVEEAFNAIDAAVKEARGEFAKAMSAPAGTVVTQNKFSFTRS